MSPGVRAIMKMPLKAAGFIHKSARMAPIAPSTWMGSDFFASGIFADATGAAAESGVAAELELTLVQPSRLVLVSASVLAWGLRN